MRIRISSVESLVLPPFTLIQLLLLLSTANAQCLFPNGTANPSPDYQPCVSDTSNPLHTICCATNRTTASGGVGLTKDTCLPNGICSNVAKSSSTSGISITYYRDGCTEKDWNSGKCLNICTDDVSLGSSRMTPCDGSSTSKTWCCGFTTDCCANNPIIIPQKFEDTQPSSSSSIKPSSTAAHPASSIKASSVSKSSSTAAGAAKPKASSTGSKSSSLGAGATAGIVVGSLAGLALVFATGYFIASRRRKVYGTPLPKEDEAQAVRYSHSAPRVVEVPAARYELSAAQKPLELPTDRPLELP